MFPFPQRVPSLDWAGKSLASIVINVYIEI